MMNRCADCSSTDTVYSRRLGIWLCVVHLILRLPVVEEPGAERKGLISDSGLAHSAPDEDEEGNWEFAFYRERRAR